MGMQKTSPFPKLLLEKTKQIVYNHHRSNQRILTYPMIVTGNMIYSYKSTRLFPIGVGNSHFSIYYDGCLCRTMPQRQPIKALRLLKCSLASSFPFPESNHQTIPTLL